MATTGRERREERRAQRLAAQQRAERAGRRRTYGLIAALAIIIIAAVVAFAVTRPPQAVPGEQHLNDPVTAKGQLYSHIPEGQPISYSSYPPAFGDHYPTPKAWQAYDSQVPDGYFVHNLEHGGIVILYHCPSGCASTVDQLKNLYNRLPKDQFNEVKLVISPYANETHEITLLAWDYRLELNSLNLSTITAFYHEHVDQGPEHIA
ncbi:MAG: DUF3105 domain-containing protein [Chloroflexota bacterium]